MKYDEEKKKIYYIKSNYKPPENNNEKVNILNRQFVESNKKNCKILYKNKIYELKEYFEDIDINYNHKDLIKLKLIFIHNIIDMSFMLYYYNSLISLSINGKTNINASNLQIHIVNMNYLFYHCNSLLISLPNISNWIHSKLFI